MTIIFKRLTEFCKIPEYATEGAAGMDLHADLSEVPSYEIVKSITMFPGETRLIKTGFAMALPRWFQAEIRPRSGLALKHGITVLNSPGTIDCDYRGEVGVILAHFGQNPFRIDHGDRIAQMVITQYHQLPMRVMKPGEELPPTDRGTGGFGSTGV